MDAQHGPNAPATPHDDLPPVEHPGFQSAPAWMYWTVGIVTLILLIIAYITIRHHTSTSSSSSNNNTNVATTVINITDTPSDSFTHVFHLKNDTRVFGPENYLMEYTAGMKYFYAQPQNGEKVLLGGKIPYTCLGNAGYVDFFMHENEEINVLLTFKKDKSCN